MQIESVKSYLASPPAEPYYGSRPYFLFVGDVFYKPTIDDLRGMGLEVVPTSVFCKEDDKLPNIGELFTHIEVAANDANEKKLVVIGLGEYLALRGKDEAMRILSLLKDTDIGNAKAVLLLRGLATQIDGLKADVRFEKHYRYDVSDDIICDVSITTATPSIGLSGLSGFKKLLEELEKGQSGNIVVNTAVNLDNEIFPVHKITSAYNAVEKTSRDGFAIAQSCGSDARWAELLAELNQNKCSLNMVFREHGFKDNLEADIYEYLVGDNYCHWLYFIALKSKTDTLNNGYLRFVIENTTRFEDYRVNILNAIIDVHHTDKRFASFYRERKELVKTFPESDIANFVVNNRKDMLECIYKLTDNTMVERKEIIAWLSQYGLVKQPKLEDIYPMLAAYMKKYVFKRTELAELLTEYFCDYKRQKLSNKLEDVFLKKVEELALSREFNQLPTRNEIIDSLDKTDTYLYWLDAFGVEYLALIETLAKEHGLSISINIARAMLPTITEFNKDFYDNWHGEKKKNRKLDEVKHKDEGGYNFTNNELPIHLASELDIIKEVINNAATELALRKCKRFLIVSDHGASRLAVLRRKEEKYDTDTKGEHSGRCCKLFQQYELPFAAEENDYLVLADYGRFKGSRAANVEVHGGASLEEVVVPIIELSLKDGSVTVRLVEEEVAVDFRHGTEITLFFDSPVKNVTVALNGKTYPALPIDELHYTVKLPDTKRANEYHADVYVDNNLIGEVTIRAQSKVAKNNDPFNDLL